MVTALFSWSGVGAGVGEPKPRPFTLLSPAEGPMSSS